MATPKKPKAPAKPKTRKKPVVSRAEKTELKRMLVHSLIAKGNDRWQTKKKFAAHFKCSPRTAERFIAEFIADFRKNHELSADDRRAVSKLRWETIFADETLPWPIRVRALENMDKIEGNHAPTKVATTDVGGKDVPPDNVRRLTLTELDAELDRLSSGNASETP